MITSDTFYKLVDNPTNVNRVVAFKIKQGIEFIARVVEPEDHPGIEGGPADGPTVVELEKVRLMNIQYNQHHQIIASLVPFSNSNDDAKMTFSLDEVIAVYTPSNVVEQDYVQSTTEIELAGV